jgi:hypothetical protein
MVRRYERWLIGFEIVACIIPFAMFIAFLPRHRHGVVLVALGAYAWFSLAWLLTNVWDRRLSQIPWFIRIGCGAGVLLTVLFLWATFEFVQAGGFGGSAYAWRPADTLASLPLFFAWSYIVFSAPSVLAGHLLWIAWRLQKRSNYTVEPDARESGARGSP